MQTLSGLARAADLGKWRALGERLFDAVLADVTSIRFMVQAGTIVLAGLAAYWLAPFLRRLLQRLLHPILPQKGVDTLSPVLSSIATPGLWALLLWLAAEGGRGLDVRMGLTFDAVELLIAWIVIRLLSHGVRHPLWSRAIFVTAFTVVALDIMGLLPLIEGSLDRIGFPYGAVRISGLNVVRALIVLGFLLWITTRIRNFLERRISETRALTPALQALLLQVSRLVLPALAVVAALPVLGLNLTALTVFGGAFAVGAGLGLQKIIANLVSGFILLGTNTIKPGDIIAVKDMAGASTYGRVTSIGANFLVMRTRSGVEFLVPNETLLTNSVENWTYSDNRIRLSVAFNIVYGSDVRRAMALAEEAAQSVPRILANPKPVCLLKNFGSGSIEMELQLWIDDPMSGVADARSECLLQIWDRLTAAGIKLPVPGPTSVVLTQPPPATA